MPEPPQGRPLRLDPTAVSADLSLPAFLAPPRGAPVYHGFPLIEETRTHGWVYGAITEVPDPEDGTEGDAYVVAPDGARAGLVWSVGAHATRRSRGLERRRWGVFEIAFPRPVRTLPDLVFCFRHVLPELQALYAAHLARRRRVGWIATVLALVAILGFAYFVWPTP